MTATLLDASGPNVADAKAIETLQSQTVTEQLAHTTPGVSINEMQGNPLQPDINFRGFPNVRLMQLIGEPTQAP